MTRSKDEVARLLAGAAKTIQGVRYCWLITGSAAGACHARPMGRILSDADVSDWTIRFVTDGRSHKAAELRRSGEAALIFQNEAEDAYVVLSGKAALLSDDAAFRRHWKEAYGVYFPTETDRANVAFIEMPIARMELWIRGVTPEPFGMRATILERDGGSGWRLKND